MAVGIHDRAGDLWRGFPEVTPPDMDLRSRCNRDPLSCVLSPPQTVSGYCHLSGKKKVVNFTCASKTKAGERMKKNRLVGAFKLVTSQLRLYQDIIVKPHRRLHCYGLDYEFQNCLTRTGHLFFKSVYREILCLILLSL